MVINKFIPRLSLDMINMVRNPINIDGDYKKDINGVEGNGFSDILKNQLDKVNDYQIKSSNNIEKYINGEDIDLYEVMVSAKEASMTLQMAVEIRNKLVEAYSEINKMQV